jgi:hypothetical protein
MAGLAWAVAPQALAQQQNNPECLGNSCGSPNEEGGGCSCSCGCSVWVAQSDIGTTLSYTDDTDGDGIPDYADNCWLVPNPDQKDSDGDAIGDACDNCAFIANADQKDTNGNGIGDLCDADMDGDGIADKVLTKDANGNVTGSTAITSGPNDNCPLIPNANQTVTCVSGNANCAGYVATVGDACNSDIDNDGVPNTKDDCPFYADSAQNGASTLAANLVATLCTGIDTDGDGVPDFRDNCPYVANSDQKDTNANGIGDVCDADMDSDGISDKVLIKDANNNVTGSTNIPVLSGGDNCPTVANHDQLDSTNSGIGDACRTSYCFVVDRSQPSQCLDPKAPFTANAGVEATLAVGDTIVPPVWANRKGEAISYTWTVVSAPSGSSAAVKNAVGTVTVSHLWSYQYVQNQMPTFTPDAEGQYTLQLQASLVYPDNAYPSVTSSTAQLKLTVGATSNGQASSSGCSTSGGVAPLLGLALGLGLLIRRKRS